MTTQTMDANAGIMRVPKDAQSRVTAQTMDAAKLQERIAQSAASVTVWAAARLVRDLKAGEPIPISELFTDYEAFCRDEKRPALPRKVWIGAMKLAGFYTDSGAFSALRLR